MWEIKKLVSFTRNPRRDNQRPHSTWLTLGNNCATRFHSYIIHTVRLSCWILFIAFYLYYVWRIHASRESCTIIGKLYNSAAAQKEQSAPYPLKMKFSWVKHGHNWNTSNCGETSVLWHITLKPVCPNRNMLHTCDICHFWCSHLVHACVRKLVILCA